MSATIDIDPARVDAIVERWGRDPEFAIEMLQDVQDAFRHLPRPVLLQISRAIGTDPGRLYHIATFYKAFSLEPRGEHSVQVCLGTACHVRGAARVMEALGRELDIEPGGTTADLRYSLDGVRCLGCCSLAPVVAIDETLYAHTDSSKVGRVLRRHGRGKRSDGADGSDGEERSDA